MAALASGEPSRVMAWLDSVAAKNVDEPVLAAWMAALREHLGACRSIKGGFASETRQVDGASATIYKGQARFAKGTADVAIEFRGNAVRDFSLDSEQLPDNWFKELPDTSLYQRRGKDLLTYLLTDRPRRAFDMLGEELRQDLTLDRLTMMTATGPLQRGELVSIAYATQRYRHDASGHYLTIYYDITSSKGRSRGQVQFRFTNLTGHVVRFTDGVLRPR